MNFRPKLVIQIFMTRLITIAFGRDLRGQCQEIQVPFCQGMKYTHTRMPNSFNHQKQEEAGAEIVQFRPLVDIQCSPDIRFFLCGLYTPICLKNYPNSIPVCRSVCERVKRSCFPIMKQYGFDWPPKMECSILPKKGTELCMDPLDGDQLSEPQKISVDLQDNSTEYQENVNLESSKSNSCFASKDLIELPDGFKTPDVGTVSKCAWTCFGKGHSVDREDPYTIEMVLSTLSIVCLIGSCLTVFTFIVDGSRFDYPAKPIMYISLCYAMIAIGFVIRLSVGHNNSACSETSGVFFTKYGITFHSKDVVCLIVFSLIYYFGMAAQIWWTCLTISWFLSSSLKWAPEAIARFSKWFHLVSWIIPSIQTIIIIQLNAVDGDPTTGICYVGSQNRYHLMTWVIIPSVIYLSLASGFFLKGLQSLFKIYRSLPRGPSIKNFKKFMIRVIIFSILFSIPNFGVLSICLMELWNVDTWEASLVCSRCANSKLFSFLISRLAFIKFSGMIIPGITALSWICSEKTVEISWQKILLFPDYFKKKIPVQNLQ